MLYDSNGNQIKSLLPDGSDGKVSAFVLKAIADIKQYRQSEMDDGNLSDSLTMHINKDLMITIKTPSVYDTQKDKEAAFFLDNGMGYAYIQEYVINLSQTPAKGARTYMTICLDEDMNVTSASIQEIDEDGEIYTDISVKLDPPMSFEKFFADKNTTYVEKASTDEYWVLNDNEMLFTYVAGRIEKIHAEQSFDKELQSIENPEAENLDKSSDYNLKDIETAIGNIQTEITRLQDIIEKYAHDMDTFTVMQIQNNIKECRNMIDQLPGIAEQLSQEQSSEREGYDELQGDDEEDWDIS